MIDDNDYPPALHCRNRRPLGFFVLGVVFILAFLFVFLVYPKAEITLVMASEPLKTTLEIKLDAKMEKSLPGLNILPAQAIVFSFSKPAEEYMIKQEIDKRLKKKINKDQVSLPELINYEEKDGVVEVMALVFQQAEMDQLLAIKLSEMAAEDKKILPHAKDILYYNSKTFKPVEWQAVVDVYLERTIIARQDLAEISRQLANQPINQAKERLKALPGVKEAKIQLRGGWFKKMPLISRRIRIKLEPVRN
ncbi:MAG: hypothetical protein V1684_01520 [bacterium]